MLFRSLAGAARKSRTGTVDVFKCSGYTCVSLDYVHGKHTNKSCGCMVMVKHKVFDRIHTVLQPPSMLRGRCGAIRIVTRTVDIIFIVVYFPPEISKSDMISKLVAKWVRTTVSKIGNRKSLHHCRRWRPKCQAWI